MGDLELARISFILILSIVRSLILLLTVCFELCYNIVIVFPAVGNCTVAAVLNSVFCIFEIPTALLTGKIKRAVAEQTVEIIRIAVFVTGKIFALAV